MPKPRKEPGEKTTTRVQLEFSQASMDRLAYIREKTESNTNAEVLRKALVIYEAFLDEVRAGNQFLTKDRDGNVTAIKFLI